MKIFSKVSAAAFGVACIGLASAGCGISTPKYIDYTDGASDGTTGGEAANTCQKEALSLFATTIEPAIDSTCSAVGCHANQAPGLVLKANDASGNKAVIKTYLKSDAQRFTTKFKGSHQGRDQSQTLPQTTIDTWLAKEAECG